MLSRGNERDDRVSFRFLASLFVCLPGALVGGLRLENPAVLHRWMMVVASTTRSGFALVARSEQQGDIEG